MSFLKKLLLHPQKFQFLTLKLWSRMKSRKILILGCENIPKKSSTDDLSHLGDLKSSQSPCVQSLIICSFLIFQFSGSFSAGDEFWWARRTKTTPPFLWRFFTTLLWFFSVLHFENFVWKIFFFPLNEFDFLF